jgi:hypothetical protein
VFRFGSTTNWVFYHEMNMNSQFMSSSRFGELFPRFEILASVHLSKMYSTAHSFLEMWSSQPHPEPRGRIDSPVKTNGRFQKIRFSPEEDARLSQIVAAHGAADWARIASCMGSRNARQCRERWQNYLNPTLRNGAWTAEEDELLNELFAQMGAKWNKIAHSFVNRSDISLRNRWQVLARRADKKTFQSHNSPNDVSTEESSDATIVAISSAAEPQAPQNPMELTESWEPSLGIFSDVNDLWAMWF